MFKVINAKKVLSQFQISKVAKHPLILSDFIRIINQFLLLQELKKYIKRNKILGRSKVGALSMLQQEGMR